MSRKKAERNWKSTALNITGWFLLVLGIVTASWYVLFSRWQYSLWLCNHAMIIAGLAILFRNRFWLTAMLNWAVLPVSAWCIDFLGRLLFGVHILGITEYMFTGPMLTKLLSLQHLITVPLMLYGLLLMGRPDKKAWTGTALHAAALWAISYFIITPDYNINCAHAACSITLSWLPAYRIMWPVMAFAMFSLTNFFMVRIYQTRAARHQDR
jgi:hypothetical protein